MTCEAVFRRGDFAYHVVAMNGRAVKITRYDSQTSVAKPGQELDWEELDFMLQTQIETWIFDEQRELAKAYEVQHAALQRKT